MCANWLFAKFEHMNSGEKQTREKLKTKICSSPIIHFHSAGQLIQMIGKVIIDNKFVAQQAWWYPGPVPEFFPRVRRLSAAKMLRRWVTRNREL